MPTAMADRRRCAGRRGHRQRAHRRRQRRRIRGSIACTTTCSTRCGARPCTWTSGLARRADEDTYMQTTRLDRARAALRPVRRIPAQAALPGGRAAAAAQRAISRLHRPREPRRVRHRTTVPAPAPSRASTDRCKTTRPCLAFATANPSRVRTSRPMRACACGFPSIRSSRAAGTSIMAPRRRRCSRCARSRSGRTARSSASPRASTSNASSTRSGWCAGPLSGTVLAAYPGRARLHLARLPCAACRIAARVCAELFSEGEWTPTCRWATTA